MNRRPFDIFVKRNPTNLMAFPATPDVVYGKLFEAVQLGEIFSDSKTFVDCIPLQDPAQISAAFERDHTSPGFDLRAFVLLNFELPQSRAKEFASDRSLSVEEHANGLWDVLTREADPHQDNGSLIPLPNPYVVPGGRFGEIYYWDSYFTMLGLAISERWDLIESMIENFAFLIAEYGHIPNGNRTYFLSRSQPPYFSLMVRLLADKNGEETLVRYLTALEKEYAFWMDGAEELTLAVKVVRRVALMPDGSTLNRYYDDLSLPRQESYREDLALQKNSRRDETDLYLNLRAACESGWDFSSRWLDESGDLATIRTTQLIPVDLNALLLHLEQTLFDAYKLVGQKESVERFSQLVENRMRAIQRYCWSEERGYYFDFDLQTNQCSHVIHAAGMHPLFAGIASAEEA
ncbi:MAG: trehalase family glycosidase, partial [Saprospiraceae bacterium]|nr:trehalase family glycosidase [Saprospiraceae bacterium]